MPALAFCAGAALVHALPALLPPVALTAPAVASLLLLRRRPLAATLLAGFLWTHVGAAHRLAGAWPCERDREEVVLAGRVAAPAYARAGRLDFELEGLRSPSQGPLPRRARISWYDATLVPRPGEHWRMTVRLRCRRGLANPGAGDRELDLLRQRIDATGYVAGKTRPQRQSGGDERPIERLRARIAASIAGSVPAGPSVAVLQGLSVGVRGSIPDALWEAFAVTGVAHLMAISGLHVTGCALFVLALLRAGWRIPILARVRGKLAAEVCVVVATTAGYTALAGASLPALRTLASVLLAAALRLLRRALPLHVLLALVALILVATDPLALVSAGFWLSMVATAALFTVLDSAPGWRERVRGFVRAQAAVTGLLTPILAASFGRVSLVAPAANAVAIPMFGAILLPAVLSATVLEAAWPGAAAALWRALASLLDRLWPWLDAVAAWPASSWAPSAPAAGLVAGSVLAVLTALLVPLSGLRIAAAVMLAALAFGGARRPEPGAFVLTVVDVGQGLAAIVETSHHALVFDTGARWQGGGSAARVSLVPYLRARGIRRIDRLIVSHRDSDHSGGEDALRRAFPVARTMRTPSAAGPGDEPCLRGRTWRWDGVEFRVLHPPAGFGGGDNDGSCALAIDGAGGRALLLADPEAAAEAALGETPLSADVVLLPHHGSRSSSGEALVAAVGARLGIASAGYNNRWGMPAREVVARWRRAGTTVLGTADQGAVTVRFPSRSGAIAVVTERGANRRWWRDTSNGR